MSCYCDERAAAWTGAFREVERLIDSALAGSPIPLDHGAVMHGSATFSRVQSDIPDLDVHARLRYQLDARPASLEDAQRLVIGAYAPALLALIESIRSAPGWGLIRLRTEWNSSTIDRRRFPQNLEVSWSAEDLAVGSTLTALGEVTLHDALMCSSATKVAFFMPRGSGPEPLLVDLQIDRGWTAPGGDCDLNPETTNLWFSKGSPTRDGAERAVAFERELADRFPGAYRVPDLYVERLAVGFVHRASRGELFKIARFMLLGWAFLGDRNMAERVIALFPVHRAELITHFGTLGSYMQIARKHERPADQLASWTASRVRRLNESLPRFPADTRHAIEPAAAALAAPGAPDPTDPRHWGLVNQLLRAIRDRMNSEVGAELRAAPEMLDVFPGAREAVLKA